MLPSRTYVYCSVDDHEEIKSNLIGSECSIYTSHLMNVSSVSMLNMLLVAQAEETMPKCIGSQHLLFSHNGLLLGYRDEVGDLHGI